jgi:hypothetical protein
MLHPPLAIIVAVICATCQLDTSSTLFRLLKDAQATNIASLSQGTMRARLRYKLPRDKVELDVDTVVHWDGPRAFWLYNVKDAGGILTGRKISDAASAVSFKGYFMRTPTALYVFNNENQLFIRDPRKFSRQSQFMKLLDVTPANCWFRGFPPYGTEGPLWSELIGRGPRGTKTDGALSITPDGDDRVVQLRKDPDGGTFEVTFSLQQAGNVVRSRYTAGSTKAKSRTGDYVWTKQVPAGLFTLKACEFATYMPGSTRVIYDHYRLDIDYVDLSHPQPSTFTLENMRGYIPSDCIVRDEINARPTSGTARSDVSAADFERLAVEIRSRGFLKPL